MASTVNPSAPDKITELEARLHQLETSRAETVELKTPSLGLTNMLQGVTLAMVVACAFWLGSLSSTVSTTAVRLERLESAVLGASRDSVISRLAVVETRLDGIDRKLDSIDKKLDRILEK